MTDTHASSKPHRRRRVRLGRNSLLFIMGAGTLLHEVLISQQERPQIIWAALFLMGAPALLRVDETRSRRDAHPDDQDEE